MQDERLASIIIPAYNVGEYLDECIESVIKQTYENLELIVIDDGADDFSAYICDSWASKDERIIAIHKHNAGLSDSRNIGIEVSIGDYVSFVDGDDSISDRLLDTVIPYIQQGYDTVTFGYNHVYNGVVKEITSFEKQAFIIDDDNAKTNFVIGPFFQFKVGWQVWSQVYNRRIIDDYCLNFIDTKVVFAEDQLFNLCYFAHASRVQVLDECLYNYTRRDSSLAGVVRNSRVSTVGRMNNLAQILKEYYSRWTDCETLLRIFPLIHYLIVERSIQRLELIGGYSSKEICNIVRNDIIKTSNYDEFRMNMQRVPSFAAYLYGNYAVAKTLSKIVRAKGIVNDTPLYWLLVKGYHAFKWVKIIRKPSNEHFNSN